MNGKILVIIEHRENEIIEVSWELLSGIGQWAEDHKMELEGVLLGYDLEKIVEELGGYVGKLYYVEDRNLGVYTWEYYMQALVSLIQKAKPRLIILGHTSMGMDLGPRLAAATGSPYLPDCLDLEFIEKDLVATREIFGGKLNAKVRAVPSEHYFLTVRSGRYRTDAAPGVEKRIEKISHMFDTTSLKTKFFELIKPSQEGIDISKSDVVIGVGRGIGDKDKMKVVEELAEATGGVLAATRPIIDNGWLPGERQVGQSGKIIKPKLYIACGISGASQHNIGVKKSETIVAINVDPRAPIFRIAHYGMVGDLFEIVPAITAKIRSTK
jgi:electron transfer flavoprotein alpha subunit